MLIGITGLIGAGKDYSANIIIKHTPNTIKLSFADTLKDVISIVFGWDRNKLNGATPEDRIWREHLDLFWTNKLNKDWSPRIAMQTIGTDVFRNQFYSNIWVDNMEKKILTNNDKNIIIPDVRFKNEIDLLRKLNATFIRVERGNKPIYWDYAFNVNTNKYQDSTVVINTFLKDVHPSEWDWIGYDKPSYIISNNSTVEKLEENVLKFMETL